MELLHELLTEQMLDMAKRDKVQENKEIHKWGIRTEVSVFKIGPWMLQSGAAVHYVVANEIVSSIIQQAT
jgi:hypothetical protein